MIMPKIALVLIFYVQVYSVYGRLDQSFTNLRKRCYNYDHANMRHLNPATFKKPFCKTNCYNYIPKARIHREGKLS